MPKIKQVATKRPRNQSAFPFPVAVKRAIKSVIRPIEEPIITTSKNNNLPRIPQRFTQIISSINKSSSSDISASSEPRSSIPPVLKKIQKEVIVRPSKFQTYSIPKRCFQKCVRNIAFKFIQDCRFTPEAIEALQTAAEDFMVGFFEDAASCMSHAKRKTLMIKDIELTAKLRKFEYEPL